MKKRLLGVLLALCMMHCIIPVAAFAANVGSRQSVLASASGGTVTVSTAAELTSAVSDDETCETVKMTADITIDTTLSVKRTVTLDLNGCVLKYENSEPGHVVMVEKGTLTISDSDRTKYHKFTPDSSGLWVLDEANGTESLPGGIITGGHYEWGGGVYVMPDVGGKYNTALVMNGGAIVGCKADRRGGGVFGYDITMNTPARIVGCTAGTFGGGVYVSLGKIVMNGGTIENCTAGKGGGVYLHGPFDSFIMSGGRIAYCHATSCGGGVYTDGIFNMSGNAFIFGCTVGDEGAGSGLYADKDSTCTLDGGRLGTKNSEKAGYDGVVNKGTINGSGATIYGKVVNESSGTITGGTYNGTVQNNKGTVTGGNFTTRSGTLVITFNPDNGEEVTGQEVKWSKNGAKLTEPSPPPTKEGYTFVGWHYDNNGTKTKWNFASDKVKYTMTLTAVFEKTHVHTWGEWISDGNGTHTRTCSEDSGHTETVNCSGGTPTCIAKAVCDFCHRSYGTENPVNHSGTEQWITTAATHTKKWSCCGAQITEIEAHKWADGMCGECEYTCLHTDGDKDHTCDYCGKTMSEHADENKDHNCDYCGKTMSEHSDEDKNHICDYCGKTMSEHADENKNHICDYCGKTMSEHADGDKNHICDYCGKIISDHTGGKATCKNKAVCGICGNAYGETDANNHENLVHFPAKAATKDAEGNIEYYRCDGCGKYYRDAAATMEISEADTVTAKLPDDPKPPQTGDNGRLAMLIALLSVCGCFCTMSMKYGKCHKL